MAEPISGALVARRARGGAQLEAQPLGRREGAGGLKAGGRLRPRCVASRPAPLPRAGLLRAGLGRHHRPGVPLVRGAGEGGNSPSAPRAALRAWGGGSRLGASPAAGRRRAGSAPAAGGRGAAGGCRHAGSGCRYRGGPQR